MDALASLQARLQHAFRDPALLALALTHRSSSADHNERLEFLGDSVLNLAVAALLYERLRDMPEGDLSRVRANLVKQETLHGLAVELGLPAMLKLGEGESRSGGHRRPSILADTLEAIIGAVHLDAGYPAAEALVHRRFQSVAITPQMPAIAKDPKTELQEWLQGRKMKLPAYRIAATLGDLGEPGVQVVDVAAHRVRIGLEIGRAGVELRVQDRHGVSRQATIKRGST